MCDKIFEIKQFYKFLLKYGTLNSPNLLRDQSRNYHWAEKIMGSKQ